MLACQTNATPQRYMPVCPSPRPLPCVKTIAAVGNRPANVPCSCSHKPWVSSILGYNAVKPDQVHAPDKRNFRKSNIRCLHLLRRVVKIQPQCCRQASNKELFPRPIWQPDSWQFKTQSKSQSGINLSGVSRVVRRFRHTKPLFLFQSSLKQWWWWGRLRCSRQQSQWREQPRRQLGSQTWRRPQ